MSGFSSLSKLNLADVEVLLDGWEPTRRLVNSDPDVDRTALPDPRAMVTTIGTLLDDLWHYACALTALVKHEDEPCRLDHHGYCQEHGIMDVPCTVELARRMLRLDGGEDMTP